MEEGEASMNRKVKPAVISVMSRNKVVWLFPDASVARQTLEEIMKYIEIQGT